MELNELKSMWMEDYDQLQSSLSLNKEMINKSSIKSSISEYKKLRSVSIMGRNMALVYAAISIISAVIIFSNFIYSIPLIIGGLAMIYSFTQHLAIDGQTNYYELSVLELQRRIQRFRIHTAKHKVYDGGIVLLWFITITPAFLNYFRDYDVYSSMSNFITFAGIAALLFIILGIGVHLMYNNIDKELKDAEGALEEIDMFEGFTG